MGILEGLDPKSLQPPSLPSAEPRLVWVATSRQLWHASGRYTAPKAGSKLAI